MWPLAVILNVKGPPAFFLPSNWKRRIMTISQINPCLGVFCFFQLSLILTAEASSLITFALNTTFVSEIKATSPTTVIHCLYSSYPKGKLQSLLALPIPHSSTPSSHVISGLSQLCVCCHKACWPLRFRAPRKYVKNSEMVLWSQDTEGPLATICLNPRISIWKHAELKAAGFRDRWGSYKMKKGLRDNMDRSHPIGDYSRFQTWLVIVLLTFLLPC